MWSQFQFEAVRSKSGVWLEGREGGISERRSAAAHSHLHRKKTLTGRKTKTTWCQEEGGEGGNHPHPERTIGLMKEVLHLVPLRVSSFSGRHDDTSCNLSAKVKTNLELHGVLGGGGTTDCCGGWYSVWIDPD